MPCRWTCSGWRRCMWRSACGRSCCRTSASCSGPPPAPGCVGFAYSRILRRVCVFSTGLPCHRCFPAGSQRQRGSALHTPSAATPPSSPCHMAGCQACRVMGSIVCWVSLLSLSRYWAFLAMGPFRPPVKGGRHRARQLECLSLQGQQHVLLYFALHSKPLIRQIFHSPTAAPSLDARGSAHRVSLDSLQTHRSTGVCIGETVFCLESIRCNTFKPTKTY